jgi:hypothetical protein
MYWRKSLLSLAAILAIAQAQNGTESTTASPSASSVEITSQITDAPVAGPAANIQNKKGDSHIDSDDIHKTPICSAQTTTVTVYPEPPPPCPKCYPSTVVSVSTTTDVEYITSTQISYVTVYETTTEIDTYVSTVSCALPRSYRFRSIQGKTE